MGRAKYFAIIIAAKPTKQNGVASSISLSSYRKLRRYPHAGAHYESLDHYLKPLSNLCVQCIDTKFSVTDWHPVLQVQAN